MMSYILKMKKMNHTALNKLWLGSPSSSKGSATGVASMATKHMNAGVAEAIVPEYKAEVVPEVKSTEEDDKAEVVHVGKAKDQLESSKANAIIVTRLDTGSKTVSC